MRRRGGAVTWGLLLLALGSRTAAAEGDTLLGITWQGSRLVSFEPRSGTLVRQHLQLNPREAFRALAYDPNHHLLYAMPQSTQNLYVIDTQTLELRHIGNLRIDKRAPGYQDAASLAYDSRTDTLYTAIQHWEGWDLGRIWSELCTVDPRSGALETVGRIDDLLIDSLAYGENDGELYGLAVYASGSWDSPDTTRVIRLDPASAATAVLFATPYHTMLGLAMPRPSTFVSWINWTSHFYGETSLDTELTTPLGDSDAVDVVSAMTSRDFPLDAQTLPVPSSPASFVFTGRIETVWDPGNVLGGRIRVGERFAGRFSYDAAAPYEWPDPNAGRPYGISLQIGALHYAASGLGATITNNLYNSYTQTVSDEFQLQGQTSGQATIAWSLGDETALALSGNDRLPTEFNLAAWSHNLFVVTGREKGSRRPPYSLYGYVSQVVSLPPSALPTGRRPPRRP